MGEGGRSTDGQDRRTEGPVGPVRTVGPEGVGEGGEKAGLTVRMQVGCHPYGRREGKFAAKLRSVY